MQNTSSRPRRLFEGGDIIKAGQIWQAILKRQPGHAEAMEGLCKVKPSAWGTQAGLDEPPRAPERQTLTPPPAEINALLEAGCALYDAGLKARAIATWELALTKDPGNALARGYIEGARRAMDAEKPAEAAAPGPAGKAPGRGAGQAPAGRLHPLRHGPDRGRPPKWERILALEPAHSLARAYANDARRDLGLRPLAPGALPGAAAAPGPAEPLRADAGEAPEEAPPRPTGWSGKVSRSTTWAWWTRP